MFCKHARIGHALTTLCLALSAGAAHAEQKAQAAAVKGFADVHIHQLAELGFGGKYYWGTHDGDVATALRPCSGHSLDGHGFVNGAEGGSVGNLTKHDKSGYPHFRRWPRWDSTSHHQAHASHMEQAWKSGMRVAVVSLVHNRDVCKIIPRLLRKKDAQCDDLSNVEAQARAAWAFEKKHAWYRIALTPADARRIASEGNLAVILALETSNAFDDAKDVLARLRHYHKLGIRSVQMVHELDNRMGGAAWHAVPIRALQTLHNLADARPRVDKLFGELAAAFRRKTSNGDGVVTRVGSALRGLVNRTLGMELDAQRNNAKGLTAEGRAVVAEMMRLGMIVDVSHLSRKAVREVLEMSRAQRYYPLMSSHTHVAETEAPANRFEWAYPLSLLAQVAETGGVVGLRTGPDRLARYTDARVADDCHGSVKSFAQLYELLTRELKMPVAFGSDVNGWALNLVPRFGRDACKTADKSARAAQRAAQKQRTGSFYDEAGLAHIGTVGDVLKDLRALGADVAPLEASAEQVVHMWERTQDPKRTRVPLGGDVAVALSKLIPLRGKPPAIERFRVEADRLFNKTVEIGCVIEACVRSPRQCWKGKGKAFDSDLRKCSKGKSGVARTFTNKVAFLRCAGRWVKKGLTPLSGVKLRQVPSKIRAKCQLR